MINGANEVKFKDFEHVCICNGVPYDMKCETGNLRTLLQLKDAHHSLINMLEEA